MKNTNEERCYYMDWLRLLGILCVFFFHNLRFFDLIDWEVKNKATFLSPTILVMFINFWIMPLFFMLSGASTSFELKAKTVGSYIRAKYWRLAIPFLFGLVVLVPPQIYLESLDKGRFSGAFLEFLSWYYGYKIFTINLGFSPVWFGHLGKHLWFLAFLFIFSVLALPIFCYLNTEKGRDYINQMARITKRAGGIYLFMVPLFVVQVILRPLFSKYPSWADFTYWFLIFIIGYIFFSDKRFMAAVEKCKYISLASGVVLWAVLITLFTHFLEYLKIWWDRPDYSLGCIFFHAIWVSSTWFCLMFFLGIGKSTMNFRRDWLYNLNEAVMPFYMLHQTIILVIGFQIIQWPVGAVVKYIIISISSFAAIAAVYYCVISRFNLVRLLFGMKPTLSNVKLESYQFKNK
ncbi:acyltransferase family protein [Anaerospora hongkongensis]|uniref:acyltransferase family protein n=1 Tax=Anaerospora hongkongensis TaxID=244830 RepID=UPI0028A08DAC|nr:acyltransferase family protein [Anaerospora hongkongensis]